ncbi:MAG: AsnC family transcriptional regulator [Acidobacteria bacterium OLB17]|nr:MAG: AsnC family transcriptional regulator [Acidobacteria bacterium OLB17]MCZ2390479.1 Lrp/AsnC family transcriptional regulator [Acidobacteriota bacterium]
MIDAIDSKILTILQKDARTSNAEIARSVGLAPSAVLERVRKLEEKGVIRGYHMDIDPRMFDYSLTAFVAVRTSGCGEEPHLVAIPEVLEVHDVAGEDSYLLKVRVKDAEHLGRLLREKIKPIAAVTGTRTTVVLKTFKETTQLPIGEQAAKDKKTKPGKKK